LPDTVKIRIAQMLDTLRSGGLIALLRKAVFLKRTIILVEKDLSEVVERPQPLASSNLKLLEIGKDMLSSGTYRFAVGYRYLKALHYLEHGLGGFVIARDNLIVGDMWYCPAFLHQHLRQFAFETKRQDHVYTFDIFVAPAERKRGVSAAFQNNAILCLRSKGYTKAYGFYFADNLPAIWCTRVTNKWKEVRAATVSRFFIFTKVTPRQNTRPNR
jgi:GNAT superfamily N-acetyltransferase